MLIKLGQEAFDMDKFLSNFFALVDRMSGGQEVQLNLSSWFLSSQVSHQLVYTSCEPASRH
jgi:hypothetical protein